VWTVLLLHHTDNHGGSADEINAHEECRFVVVVTLMYHWILCDPVDPLWSHASQRIESMGVQQQDHSQHLISHIDIDIDVGVVATVSNHPVLAQPEVFDFSTHQPERSREEFI